MDIVPINIYRCLLTIQEQGVLHQVNRLFAELTSHTNTRRGAFLAQLYPYISNVNLQLHEWKFISKRKSFIIFRNGYLCLITNRQYKPLQNLTIDTHLLPQVLDIIPANILSNTNPVSNRQLVSAKVRSNYITFGGFDPQNHLDIYSVMAKNNLILYNVHEYEFHTRCRMIRHYILFHPKYLGRDGKLRNKTMIRVSEAPNMRKILKKMGFSHLKFVHLKLR